MAACVTIHATSPIAVHFVLLPGSLILDWAGPAEALRIANQLHLAQGLSAPFTLRFVGPDGEAVTSVGVSVSGLSPLPDVAANSAQCHWIVLVGQPGSTIVLDSPAARHVLHWLRGLHLEAGRRELMCICAGTLIAARAGLLAGRRATTHHHHLDELRHAEPRCEVVANRVFVEDGPVFSSAGVTTGIDLVLHRMAAVCGHTVVAQVAQTMVVALRRGPNDPELSPFLNHRNHLHAALHRLQDAVSQEPAGDWSVPRMAALAHVSPRHLTRLFMAHAGIAPLQYLRGLRLASAEAVLQAGAANVTQAAAQAGFSSDAQLRRTWRQFGKAQTPSERRTRRAPKN